MGLQPLVLILGYHGYGYHMVSHVEIQQNVPTLQVAHCGSVSSVPIQSAIHTHLCAYSSKPKKDRAVNHHYLWDFTLDLFVVAVLHAYIPVSTETDPESLEPPFATGKEVARREKKVNTLYILVFLQGGGPWSGMLL